MPFLPEFNGGQPLNPLDLLGGNFSITGVQAPGDLYLEPPRATVKITPDEFKSGGSKGMPIRMTSCLKMFSLSVFVKSRDIVAAINSTG